MPTTLSSPTQTACYHCGETGEEIIYDEKVFCCNGCQMVYQLLVESNLGNYYELEERPGTSLQKVNKKLEYAYLDLEEVQEELVDFREGGIVRVSMAVPAIHCASCVYLLEHLPQIAEGVKTVTVDFIKRTASFTFWEKEISLRQLAELLTKIGYVPDFSINKKKGNTITGQYSRSQGLKIGLAGFCFGNIMLLSFPEYLVWDRSMLEAYQPFFCWLNFVLALPVLLYCARDYFTSAYHSLQQRIIGIDIPIVIGITALFGRSTYEIFTYTGAGYMDSFTGLIFFLLIGKWYQSKTYQALSFDRDYTSYFPIAVVQMIRDREEQILIKDLKKGAIIKIKNQQIIPADSILVSEEAAVDYSFVTGESEEVIKSKGDKIYAGGRQMGASILVEIQKEVNQSYFIQLWNQDVFVKKGNQALFSKTVDQISHYFTLVILTIAALTAMYWFFYDSSKAVLAATSVLIIACPCALALAAPFALGNMLRVFGKYGLFLKNTAVVEKIGNITDIVFDKTGTLTTNKSASVRFVGTPLSTRQKELIHALIQHSTHPLSQMIRHTLTKYAVDVPIEDYQEVEGMGVSGRYKGELIKIGAAKWTGWIAQLGVKDTYLTSKVYIAFGKQQMGYFSVKKEYRKGLEGVIASLQENQNLHVLSGDNASEKVYLAQYFDHADQLHFNQTPLKKLEYIQRLQSRGKQVMMIGDGLNDAGALQQADVGLAISNDVYSFSPSSDGILEAKIFEQLSSFIQMSKRSLLVIRFSFILSLLYNIIGLSFAVQATLTPLIAAILMPLSSISVVLFVFLGTNWITRKLEHV